MWYKVAPQWCLLVYKPHEDHNEYLAWTMINQSILNNLAMVYPPNGPRTSIPPYLRNSSLFKEFLLKIPP